MAFIFDANSGETPETIARQREIAAMLMGQGNLVAPRNTMDGIGNAFASIAGGAAAGAWNRKADEAEKAGREGANSLFQQLVGGISNGTPITGAPASPDGAGVPAANMDPYQARGGFSGSQQEFVNMLLPAAMEASKQTGIDPRIIVAQAAQETGWGKSAPGNNFFGIKSHGAPGGQTLATNEVVNGQTVPTQASFRTYESPQASVQGYAEFMTSNPRYQGMRSAQGLDAQLQALGQSGYATDPNYASSVGQIARGIPLPGDDQAQMPANALPTQGAAQQQPQQMQGGPSLQQIMQVLSNPWSTPQQRATAELLLKQQMEAQDPMRQLQMEKGRLEIDALRNPQPKPTDDIREYEFARQQGYQGTFTDFQTEMRRAGATNVNVGGAEKGFDKTVGEGYGKRFLGMQEEAQAAQRALNALDVMEQSLNDPNFYSGFGAERALQLKRLGAAMGLDPNGITSMETFNSMTKQAALDTMGGSLGTGFSNADRDFVIDQVPNAGNTPEGNRRLVEIQRKLNQRKQQIAQIARGYAAEHNGRIDAGFDDYLSKWAEQNPLFQASQGQSTSGNDLKSKYGLE